MEPLEDRLAPSIDLVTTLSGDPNVMNSLPWWVNHAQANDTIYIEAGLPGNTITLTGNGLLGLDINKNLNIVGPGANALTISGGGQNEVIYVEGGVTASISGVEISEGGDIEVGGGIYIATDGNLTLTNVEVADNQVTNSASNGSAYGGGIANYGTLTLTASTVDNNTANAVSGYGGGIYNAAGGTLTMFNDTLANNTAQGFGVSAEGGGIYNAAGGTVRMNSDTVADNTVTTPAITGVVALDGGGIYNGGSLALLNTIVYNPASPLPSVSDPDVSGTINVDGNNLFGSNVSSQILESGGNDQFDANPLLGSLQNNGGTTPTMALLPGSPAIDAALPGAVSMNDQRGFNRLVGSAPDIGAYEYQPPATTTSLAVSSTSVQPGQAVTLTATMAGTASNSNTPQGSVTFFNGSNPLGTVTLNGGMATLTTTLPAGSNSITATYSGETIGDFVFDSSSSNAVTVTVSSGGGGGGWTPPSLNVPPLLAYFDAFLGGSETVNYANETETIVDSFFGFPLLVSTFNSSGDLVSVTLLGFNVTFFFV